MPTSFTGGAPQGRQRCVGRTTFARPSVLLPGPFGNRLNLNGRCLTNNPVKSLKWAAVNPIVRVENRLRSGGATPTRTKQTTPFGKHFYSLPRISTRVPARN